MRALVRDRYGPPDVLALEDVPEPRPGAGEVLIEVTASSLNAGDHYVLRGEPYPLRLMTGLLRPKTRGMGQDVAGVVVEVGADVTAFAEGDRVFGEALLGATWADRAAVAASTLARVPDGVPLATAAVVPVAGLTALQAVRDRGRVRAGQRVLVNGASGGVGTFVVQIAKAYGAHVTGVCGPSNVELVRALGADDVIDYSVDDFTEGATPYDVLLDIAGNRRFADVRRVLPKGGTYVGIGGPAGKWFRALFRMVGTTLAAKTSGRRAVFFVSEPNADDLATLAALLADGALQPAVSATLDLADVPEGLRRIAGGHTRGKIAVRVRD